MIAHLAGNLLTRRGSSIVVNVGGVGYLVEMHLRDLARIKGESIAVWIHMHVREDQIRLFGFLNQIDRDFFELLTTVSGIGPKLGLGILSTLSPAQICNAVELDQHERLLMIPGVGARLAEKLVVELRPKVKRWALRPDIQSRSGAVTGNPDLLSNLEPENEYLSDLRSALENFSYNNKQIALAIKGVKTEEYDDFSAVLRHVLTKLSSSTFA